MSWKGKSSERHKGADISPERFLKRVTRNWIFTRRTTEDKLFPSFLKNTTSFTFRDRHFRLLILSRVQSTRAHERQIRFPTGISFNRKRSNEPKLPTLEIREKWILSCDTTSTTLLPIPRITSCMIFKSLRTLQW